MFKYFAFIEVFIKVASYAGVLITLLTSKAFFTRGYIFHFDYEAISYVFLQTFR